MDLARYPLPHPQVAARVVDGSAIIVLADSGEVNVLNATGTRMWELMDGTHSLREIAEAINTEYDVALDQALQDVQEFAQGLLDHNVLILQEQPVRGD